MLASYVQFCVMLVRRYQGALKAIWSEAASSQQIRELAGALEALVADDTRDLAAASRRRAVL